MKATILLEGEAYDLCPSFEALSLIEQELGAGLTALAVKLMDGAMTLEELVVIIKHCLEPQMPKSFIEKAFLRSGFTQVVEAVATMFALVFAGNYSGDRQELQLMIERFPDAF